MIELYALLVLPLSAIFVGIFLYFLTNIIAWQQVALLVWPEHPSGQCNITALASAVRHQPVQARGITSLYAQFSYKLQFQRKYFKENIQLKSHNLISIYYQLDGFNLFENVHYIALLKTSILLNYLLN